ncbi:MAG: leucine-rich repeat protein [Clostridiales bacterium]|jgi:hypothetical protein|nr:leucine-rich repeat protein [Clostridiales bacterium]
MTNANFRLKNIVFLLSLVIMAALVALPVLAGAGKTAANGDPPELKRAVISPDDFEFIGAFTLPKGQPDPQTNYWLGYYRGLTHRYVDGRLKLYTIPGPYSRPAPSGHLMELEVPEYLSLTQPYPGQNVYQSFGDIYQDKITQTAVDGSAYFSFDKPGIGLAGIVTMIDGIFWDEADQRLYWTKVTRYDTGSSPDTALGFAVLDDSTHTGTGIGSWVIPSDTGRRWSFSLTAIPDWFAAKYLGGRRLGVGFGGSNVSISSNGVSFGPALFAIKPPDPAVEPHMSELITPSIPLISHIFGREFPARRNISIPLLMVENEGDLFSFGNSGADSRSGVWIDGENRHGLLVFASLPAGNTDTKVISAISPLSLELADIGDIMPGDLLQVHTDWTGVKGYQTEISTVSEVRGNVVTFSESLQGNPILEDYTAEVTWLDDTKSTVNYENRVVCGGWYHGGGPRFSRYHNAWYIYDPAGLAEVAQGALRRDLIRPLFNGPAGLPNVLYPIPGDQRGRIVMGATFDNIEGKLYLLDDTDTIYVYQFHDEPAGGYEKPPVLDPATDVLVAGNCGEKEKNVRWALYRDGRLEIYGEGRMKDNVWNLYKSNIRSVVIKDGVTNIGNSAFGGCTDLSSVTLAESVREIGAFAFNNCAGLTEFDAPGVISVQTQAFMGCSNLERLRLGCERTPGDATGSIDNYHVFYGCNKLTEVYLGEGITKIGGEFGGKPALQSIRLPNTLEDGFSLGSCVSLTEIVIPEGITMIGYEAFSGCTSLAAVTFPASLVSLDVSAFRNDSSLQTLIFKGGTAPMLASRAFERISDSGTVYYPGGEALNYTAAYFNIATSGGNQFNGWIFNVKEDTATVRGKIKSFILTDPPTVRLMKGKNTIYTATIDKTNGSDQVEQDFIFDKVAPDTYDLVITKAGYTKFTVLNLLVSDEGLDLTKDSRPEVQLMTLRCGDINGDGLINDADLTILWRAGNYNKKAAEADEPHCDLNGDGLINDADLTILWLAYNYNRGAIVIE